MSFTFHREWMIGTIRGRLRSLIARDIFCKLWRKAFLVDRIVVLMYHEVLGDDQDIEAWTVVKENAFRGQMEYLRREFQIIGLHDALEVFRSPSDNKERYAVVTFDDGYAGNLYHALPVIESMGIPATIFVATQAIAEQKVHWFDDVIVLLQSITPRTMRMSREKGKLELEMVRQTMQGEMRWNSIETVLSALKRLEPEQREATLRTIFEKWGRPAPERTLLRPMSIAELKEISRSPYITIGAHSHGHELLDQLPPEQIRETLETSRELLEEWTGRKPELFSYPNGNYNADVIRAVQEAGFICACITQDIPWAGSQSPFLIPRIGIGRYDSIEAFKLKVSGIPV